MEFQKKTILSKTNSIFLLRIKKSERKKSFECMRLNVYRQSFTKKKNGAGEGQRTDETGFSKIALNR